jgi:hypothetical protein
MFNSSTETVNFKLGDDSNANIDGRLIRDEASHYETHLKLHHYCNPRRRYRVSEVCF